MSGRGYQMRRRDVAIYLYGEGAGDIEDRIEQSIHYHKLDPEDVRIIAMPTIRFDVEAEVTALIEKIKKALAAYYCVGDEVALVIADTLRTSMNGSVDNDHDVESIYRGKRRVRDEFGCGVLSIHHTGHDKSRLTGSRAIRANADFVMRVSAVPPGEYAQRSLLTIQGPNQKLKRGRPASDVFINATEVEFTDAAGLPQTTLVIDAEQAQAIPLATSVVSESRAKPTATNRKAEVRAVLADDPNTSQAEMARITGIPKSSISRIYAEIEADNARA